MHLRIGALALAVAVITALAGCGSSELSAKSSCKDYVNASADEQRAAIGRLAQELHAPKVNTPLGRPNVDYLCAADGSRTLGSVISKYAEQSAPSSPPKDTTTTDESTPTNASTAAAPSPQDQAVSMLKNDTRLPPLDEPNGWQFYGRAEIEMSVYDAIMNKIKDTSEGVQILPEGMTLDTFAAVLPKALITINPDEACGSKLFCSASRVATLDESIDNTDWVVTFLPEDESKLKYLKAQRNRGQ